MLSTPREATAASSAVSVGRSATTLLGRGRSNTEPAAELTLSEATVKSHVARIFAKLTLRDRAQAVVLAYETGLVRAGGPPDS
ncbi:putative response regulator [Streptomyces lincolnensis]|uniref:Putative response regulator n=1 Tax=Streptomyces lincolnensis TaxID=1915 RepID=A0A1B1M4U4_STRLN|nr:putative response regulator [Streptomyces lincolnensis]AXG52365.1 putative response regulator [Streptomyces lincolnensis]